jgi:hypothetical protein
MMNLHAKPEVSEGTQLISFSARCVVSSTPYASSLLKLSSYNAKEMFKVLHKSPHIFKFFFCHYTVHTCVFFIFFVLFSSIILFI